MSLSTILNIVLVLILIWFIYTRFGPTKGLKTLKADAFEEMIQRTPNTMLIDVREPSEFKGGYIPGASNIPLSQIKQRLDEIPNNREILLYCRSGMRSKAAANILIKNGRTQVTHLLGGIGSWTGKVTK